MRPGKLHGPPTVPDQDHVAQVPVLEYDGPAATAAVVVDSLPDRRTGLRHREPHDLAAAGAGHLGDQRVVGVEDREAVAGYRLDDDLLHGGELLDGVDATEPEVVGGDVQDDGDVVALVAQALAQQATAGDLEDGEVDTRVLQHHPGALGARRVSPDDQALVDDDAVGRGHPDLAAQAFEDVRHHPRRRRLAVGAGDRDDRDAGRGTGREQQVDDGLRDVLRLTDRRVRVHPEARGGVDLDDAAADLADRVGDVDGHEVDAGDVEADNAGRLLGDLDVVRVGFEGPVDRDTAGRHVGGQRELHHEAPVRHGGPGEALRGQQLVGRLVEGDPREDLLVADAPPRVGVRDLDQLGDGLDAVADDVRRHPLGDGDHPAADDQEPVVAAHQVGLDDDPAAAGLALGDVEGFGDRRVVTQVEPDPAPVVAVGWLEHDREADPMGDLQRAVERPDGLGLRHRKPCRGQQLQGHLLVARDVDRKRARLGGHRGPDPLRVDPLSELHERRAVEPHPRDVPGHCLIDQRLCRRPEGGLLGEQQQPLDLADGVEVGLGLHEVVDQPDRELARRDPDGLVGVGVDHVVDPGPAGGAAGLATRHVGAGELLQLQSDVLRYVPEPGAFLQALGKATGLAS